ncbi:MAG: T3SS effector HopA1 family protein [Jatrophihabitans sp.]|uniref:T3SS effector HopA1 family protein n=1 Tax=Jatrophihabitans sp. TaxID=1932789 RepID=UPI0039105EC2
MATELPSSGAVLAGGMDGPRAAAESIGSQRPAAERFSGGAAAGPWPTWAVPQLETAIELARPAIDRLSVAGLLYREWFNPVAGDLEPLRHTPPLAGIYRAAHAGSSARIRRDDLSVIRRHDVLRIGGWWRTWGGQWIPPRTRAGSVRLLMTPRPDALAEFVATVTGALVQAPTPWSFGLAIDPRRIARYGCAVLDLPSLDALADGLLDDLEPLLRPVVSPLCLPVAPGVGVAEYPDNGMTFGEHRCHLVAMALRHPVSDKTPLRAIAAVFNAHGIDPRSPYRAS